MKRIYVDNAATTPVKKEVLDKMIPYFTENYGNPSSIYAEGQANKTAVDEARRKVADVLGCAPNEIYFTGCGTEADNWALMGVASANKTKGNHIITTAIEHHAILHTCNALEKQGFEVTYLPVDEYGLVNPDDLKKAITDKTILISIMTANNEIGTIQPIEELSRIAHEHKIIFHTDAVQAVCHVDIDLGKWKNVDLLSASAHKFNGPKGTGILYIKSGTRIHNFMNGGAQERNRRAGTENVAGIVGMAEAMVLAKADMPERTARIKEIRDYLIKAIPEKIPYCRLNGHPEKRLPGNVNFSFEFIEGESLLLLLDMNGISASSGSACTSGSLDPSHVLLAIGLKHEIAHGSLRISLDWQNTMEEAEYIVEKLVTVVDRLRAMSPLYEDVERRSKHV